MMQYMIENKEVIDIEKKEILDLDVTAGSTHRVVLFNDNTHTFEEVCLQIIKAIHCTRHLAETITNTVHTKGKSIVFEGTMMSCLRVSSILEEINLKTEIQTSTPV